METKASWQLVWEKGFQPQFSTAALESLAQALETDDPRLTQGSTTTPPPLLCISDWPVEACCPVTFCGIPAEEWAETAVGQAEEFFAKACWQADTALGEPAACRWLLNWIDDTPRPQMRSELLAVIRAELHRRAEAVAEDAAMTLYTPPELWAFDQ